MPDLSTWSGYDRWLARDYEAAWDDQDAPDDTDDLRDVDLDDLRGAA